MNNTLELKAPKNEIIWVTYWTNNQPTFVITSTRNRDYYYLYRVVNIELVKTKHKSKNPTDLEKYIK